MKSAVLTPPLTDAFRTEPLLGLPSSGRVDRQAGKIYGAKAMQIGPLNPGDSRPYKVDSVTLDQLERLVKQRNVGTKVRFAHPNMSTDGMGRHLGRAANARRVLSPDGDFTAVDITLSDAAKRSPNGDLFSHVLDLAEQTPEDFGLSLAPLMDREAMNKIQPDENGLVPVRLKQLTAIDVVDDPAATRGGMFSLDSNHLADLPARATDLLDTFFADSPAEVIRARFGSFLETYLQHRGADEMATATDSKKPEANQDLEALRAENEQLKQQVEMLGKDRAELDAKLATKPTEDAAKTQARAELERVGQIEALCKLAGVDDAKKKLMLDAGFTRQEAQDYLSKSGFLGAKNPPLNEGGTDLGDKKQTPEKKFGAEWDADKELFTQQGVTREQYIKSRLKG